MGALKKTDGWSHKQRERLVPGARALCTDGHWYEVTSHDPVARAEHFEPTGVCVMMDGHDTVCDLSDFVPGRVRSERPAHRLARIQAAVDARSNVEPEDVKWLLGLARRAVAARLK